jgi:hypothetical protein
MISKDAEPDPTMMGARRVVNGTVPERSISSTLARDRKWVEVSESRSVGVIPLRYMTWEASVACSALMKFSAHRDSISGKWPEPEPIE